LHYEVGTSWLGSNRIEELLEGFWGMVRWVPGLQK
jgi:hypothetical protein